MRSVPGRTVCGIEPGIVTETPVPHRWRTGRCISELDRQRGRAGDRGCGERCNRWSSAIPTNEDFTLVKGNDIVVLVEAHEIEIVGAIDKCLQ